MVFALRSPLGLEQIATMGIVSAMGRTDLGITGSDNLLLLVRSGEMTRFVVLEK